MPAERVGDVHGGRLTGSVGVGRQDDLRDAACIHPLDQFLDAQMLGVDAVERRERAAQHVIEAAEVAALLDGDDVAGLFHHADDGGVAARVAAEDAELVIGEVEALACRNVMRSLTATMASASAAASRAGA